MISFILKCKTKNYIILRFCDAKLSCYNVVVNYNTIVELGKYLSRNLCVLVVTWGQSMNTVNPHEVSVTHFFIKPPKYYSYYVISLWQRWTGPACIHGDFCASLVC